MNSNVAAHPSLDVTRARTARAYVLSLLGPLTIVGAVIWAFIQPYRLTLLHPHGQGFWWLVIEPQLLLAAAGVAFWLLVAHPLLAELEEGDATAR